MLKAVAQSPRSRARARGVLASVAAAVLALGAEAAVVLPCAYASHSASMSIVGGRGAEGAYTTTSSCSSMVEHHGPIVLLWFGIPVLFALLGAFAAVFDLRAPQVVFGWTIIALALVFSVLSFGVFAFYYAPAAVALIVSGLQDEVPA